jgi:hypothetical protein
MVKKENFIWIRVFFVERDFCQKAFRRHEFSEALFQQNVSSEFNYFLLLIFSHCRDKSSNMSSNEGLRVGVDVG